MKIPNKNKRKIINDPVHGFFKIPTDLIYDLLEHPVLQRLRRIKQLGLTDYVYPGACHSRFQHTIGALFLMVEVVEHLRNKNIEITGEEEEAVYIAILLHDIGHGPFSHALEESLIRGINHEDISLLLMQKLNEEFNGALNCAIEIFQNKYKKQFLHQLVSSQLDMDRLDYLKRDSFYTGVTEGVIGTERIIKMLNVFDDQLVVEAKGIYSIEKFLVARRIMYWQVYFHKTVIASENLLVNILRRAKYLSRNGKQIFATAPLKFFLEADIDKNIFLNQPFEVLNHFLSLDDSDIYVSAKEWLKSDDVLLSLLSNSLLNRELPTIMLKGEEFSDKEIHSLIKKTSEFYKISAEDAQYLVSTGEIKNNAYTSKFDTIKIQKKDGTICDIAEASDVLNISYLYKTIKKYFVCYPKIVAYADNN